MSVRSSATGKASCEVDEEKETSAYLNIGGDGDGTVEDRSRQRPLDHELSSVNNESLRGVSCFPHAERERERE